MTDVNDVTETKDDPTRASVAASLFSEVLMVEQLARALIGRSLPGGMQISHFSVLNLLAHLAEERTPAQLAEAFHVTRGAMSNTLARLEWAGHIHIRPDWDDARRKMVAISPAGVRARDAALAVITPMINELVTELGDTRVRAVLPVLRELRVKLESDD